MLKRATAKDPVLQQIKDDITKTKLCQNALTKYKQILDECSYINGVIMRGTQIISPESLQAEVIELAQKTHMGAMKTFSLLRQTCWFPQMSKLVNEYVQTCLPCSAAIPFMYPEPLKPHMLPERPWQQLHTDFKGPIGNKYYLHIIIDQFSKYPEVDVVTSTSFSELEPCLDRIMATHGIPEETSTDNGSPYFGSNIANETKRMGFRHHQVTPLDNKSNGFAENFVKIMCKLVHTSITEGKDPKKELNTYLPHYRSTPHITTNKSPAELLFGRRIQSKLPQFHSQTETRDS